MVVLIAYKNEEDPFKIEGARVVTTILPLLDYGFFPDAQEQLTPQSVVGSGRISNSSAKSGYNIFPIITLWELSVAMETRVLVRSNKYFPHPYNVSDEIRLKLVHWSQRYSCLKVWTNGHTDRLTVASSSPIL